MHKLLPLRWLAVPLFALGSYALTFMLASLLQVMFWTEPGGPPTPNEVTYALAGLAGGYVCVVTGVSVAPHSKAVAALGVACAFSAVFLMLSLFGAGSSTVPWWASAFNVAGAVLGVQRVRKDHL